MKNLFLLFCTMLIIGCESNLPPIMMPTMQEIAQQVSGGQNAQQSQQNQQGEQFLGRLPSPVQQPQIPTAPMFMAGGYGNIPPTGCSRFQMYLPQCQQLALASINTVINAASVYDQPRSNTSTSASTTTVATTQTTQSDPTTRSDEWIREHCSFNERIARLQPQNIQTECLRYVVRTHHRVISRLTHRR